MEIEPKLAEYEPPKRKDLLEVRLGDYPLNNRDFLT
jgi:hypothetical protein